MILYYGKKEALKLDNEKKKYHGIPKKDEKTKQPKEKVEKKKTVYKTTTPLRMRSMPYRHSTTVKILKRNSAVFPKDKVFESHGDQWMEVTTVDGVIGFVMFEFLKNVNNEYPIVD